MDQSTLDKRYGEDGKRTNICFTCNKAGHWARNCPDKEKQTWTTAFVYVNPYTHKLKILPTWRLGHQFQNMRYVGVLKSFCNECKIKSPQNTISVESQTEQTEKNSIQNDCENTEKKNSIQNDNTSISDSEICQTAERLERLAENLNIPKLDHRRSLFKPEKNQIKSTVINRKICHPVRKKSKRANSKTTKTRKKKRTVIFVNQKSMKIKSVQI